MSQVVPSNKRTARWNRKYDPERIKQINVEGKPEYLAAATVVNADLVQMETAVKTVLNLQGVSVAQAASYLAYGRELWKKHRQYSGEMLAIEAQTIMNKWIARQLSTAVCEAIRFGVFGISAPVGP